jgi:hypothetical protein
MLKCGRCRCCEECKKLDDEIMNAEKCLKCSDECPCLCNLEKYDSKLDNPDILSNLFMIDCGNKLHQILIKIIREQHRVLEGTLLRADAQDRRINDLITRLAMIDRINEVNIAQEIIDRLDLIESKMIKMETPRETPRKSVLDEARNVLLSPQKLDAQRTTPRPQSSRILRF